MPLEDWARPTYASLDGGDGSAHLILALSKLGAFTRPAAGGRASRSASILSLLVELMLSTSRSSLRSGRNARQHIRMGPGSRGHFCKVRVNNREYSTDVPYKSEALAREGAAMNAWMICRNFSHNDGMCPGARPGQRSANGAVQGLPVAIGTGRKVNRHSGSSYESGSSDGISTGSNSPKSLEGGFEQQIHQVTHQLPQATSRRGHGAAAAAAADDYVCYCRRAAVRAYGRCGYCLRENGWA
ncbi:hypothetical protein B0A50_00075 [Salinomyces thailandicus]|uniref:DRBM domain-containing protein n=1 Tax=Salinomyces thailandicus TaxID=706561 RepID=A0A4U0UHR3_9PEZI|nr:hypothetical protein B0A50_00075 [Salinomyces thailandica]